jgi:hypothetical protein
VEERFGEFGMPRRGSRHVVAVIALLPMLLGLIAVPGVTSAALPAVQSDTICTTPALVPFPVDNEVDNAKPVANPAATPLASPVASPVAEQDIADEGAEIEQLVQAIGACQNERRVRTLTRFVTEGYLGDLYAGGGRITDDQFVELARGLPRAPVAIVSVSRIEVQVDGGATAEVVSTIGHQLFRATWSFIFVPQDESDATGSEPVFGVWLADGIEPLPVEAPADAHKIEVELDEYSYDPAKLRVRGPNVVIAADNGGDEDHELLVLALTGDVTTRDLLTAPGPELPRGVTVVGQATIPAGSDGELVLVGMEAGDYAIVDLLLNDEGTPNLALGMEATLTVR